MNQTSLELAAMGGSFNVLNAAYAGGADPTGTNDSTAAIQAALNAAADASVLGIGVCVPPGVYKTSAPLIVAGGTVVQGPLPSQQSALGSTDDWGACFKPAAGFSGTDFNATAVFLVQEISTSAGTNRAHIRNLMIDGSAAPADVDGIAFYGSTGACSVQGVLVQYATGNGVVAYPDADGNAADGLLLRDILAQACTGHGVDITAATDATMDNVHGQGCDGDGVRFTGSNVRCFGVRGDLCTNGITLLLPAAPSGGNYSSGYSDCITLVGCGSQLNAENGLNILDDFATADTTPACPLINLMGCSFDMDGVNGGSGGGGYAGIAVNGLAVVSLTGTSVNTDTHGATGGSPEYAIATSASATGGRVPVSICAAGGSRLAGVTAICNDAAPASNWYIAPDTLTYVGEHSTHIAAASIPYSYPASLDWTAADMRYAAWAFDPAPSGAGVTTRLITGGTLNLIGMQVRQPCTVSNIVVEIAALGATLTADECYAGLFSSAGTLLGYSADQHANWEAGGSTGYQAIPLTAESAGSLSLVPGFYYVGLLANGTTMPSFQSGSNLNTQWANGRLTEFSQFRYGTNGSGLTALASFTPDSGTTITSITWWAAIY
jgi:hypothetical protein